MSDAGPYYIELIDQENQLRVFVFDDKTDGPVQTGKASATATVLAGEQSWDEMFNGYFDFVLAEQDLTQPPSAALMLRAAFRYLWTPLGKGLLSCVCVVLLLVNRCRWTYQALPQS